MDTVYIGRHLEYAEGQRDTTEGAERMYWGIVVEGYTNLLHIAAAEEDVKAKWELYKAAAPESELPPKPWWKVWGRGRSI